MEAQTLNKQLLVGKVVKIFKKYPTIMCGYLHGSYSDGTYRNDSDIDLAIYGRELNYINIRGIRDEIENTLGRKIDLSLISRTTDPLFLHRIFNYGEIIYDTDTAERLKMETIAELKYFDQQHFRDIMNAELTSRLSV